MQPYQHQIDAAYWLADRPRALLADEPRVGKTGAAILAADSTALSTILVITTVSGRSVWARAFEQWSMMGRSVFVVTSGSDRIPLGVEVVIVGWPSISVSKIRAQLLARQWSLLISDEDHFAKSFEAKRTQALYGELLADGVGLDTMKALSARAATLWCLTGTPLPHSPADMYVRLRALAPERLLADPARGWPNVTRYQDFLFRYCIVKMKQISQFRKIPVIIGGRNKDELRARLDGFILRRTQKDVGITQPVYELFPLPMDQALREPLLANPDAIRILEAADSGDTKSLEMHLGPLRRITGTLKAPVIAAAVRDDFACGLDRIVLAYWHRDVGKILVEELSEYGVTGIDGSTPGPLRAVNLQKFNNGQARVFLAQIEAAGEAIDLSASAVLWFCETTFVPRQMKQMSLRITNINQARQPIVRVCVFENSIDEAVQGALLRLWTAISEVLA